MENDIIWYNEYRIVAYKTLFSPNINPCFALQRLVAKQIDGESVLYDWYSVFYSADRNKCKKEWEKRLRNPEKYKEGQ